jgi:ankyrin repeat protein
MLLIKNIDINGYDYDGRTALKLSCSNGHLDIVKYLITHGADINLTDARGNDALADAIRENRKDVIEYLKKIKYMSPSSDI